MNKEQQRIKIAEAYGWTNCEYVASLGLAKGFPPIGFYAPFAYNDGRCQLPDYLNDLNAMHEAEKSMDDATYGKYCTNLNSIACMIQCGNKSSCGYTVSATAAQRAEAFLKTLNLWES